jgi:hypothetical protein
MGPFLFCIHAERLFLYNKCEVINMAIRDRGKKKWQFAFGMPELIKAQRDVWKEVERIKKPIIDTYEMDEFDQRICYAMEYRLTIKITVWIDGFTEEIIGRIHYVDPISHQLRIEVKPGEFHRIAFGDVVGVTVID